MGDIGFGYYGYDFTLEDHIADVVQYALGERQKEVNVVEHTRNRRIWVSGGDREEKPYCQIAEYHLAPSARLHTIAQLRDFQDLVQRWIDARTSPPEKKEEFREDEQKNVVCFGHLLYLDHIADVREERISGIEFKDDIAFNFKQYLNDKHSYHKVETTPIYIGINLYFYPTEELAKAKLQQMSFRAFNKLRPKERNVFSWFEG